jgi:hypothetical protein
VVLPDYMLIEVVFDYLRFYEVEGRAVAAAFFGWFLLAKLTVDNRFAYPYTGVADKYTSWTGDHFSYFALRFAAKRAEVDLGCLSHRG